MPKILLMPDVEKRNDDSNSVPVRGPAQLVQLSADRDEESASITRISKWLDLADAALAITQHRKRA